jgi:hypothetical protein
MSDADHRVTEAEFKAWLAARHRQLHRLQADLDTGLADGAAIRLAMARIRSNIRDIEEERAALSKPPTAPGREAKRLNGAKEVR